MIGKNAILLMGCLSLFAPAFSYAGDWGDIAFQRCWKDDRLLHKPDRSACVFKELETKRLLMQQLYDDAVRDAEKHDTLALEGDLKEFPVAADNEHAKKKRLNGPGSHAWQKAKRLRESQRAYQAYLDTEKSRIIAYVPGNGGEDAAAQQELNLIQDRIAVLEKLKH
jgi:hypothetical protein